MFISAGHISWCPAQHKFIVALAAGPGFCLAHSRTLATANCPRSGRHTNCPRSGRLANCPRSGRPAPAGVRLPSQAPLPPEGKYQSTALDQSGLCTLTWHLPPPVSALCLYNLPLARLSDTPELGVLPRRDSRTCTSRYSRLYLPSSPHLLRAAPLAPQQPPLAVDRSITALAVLRSFWALPLLYQTGQQPPSQCCGVYVLGLLLVWPTNNRLTSNRRCSAAVFMS